MTKTAVALHQSLLEGVDSKPLSQLLPTALVLAKSIDHKDFERWVRLELEGYLASNPVLTDDTVVPDYRTVAGQRMDEFGRVLFIEDRRLHFMNEDRLRLGVAELERLEASQSLLSYRDPIASTSIREVLEVEVTRFAFHPSEVTGVLTAIRVRLLDWLNEVKPATGAMHSDAGPEPSSRPAGSRRSGKLAGIGISLVSVGIIAGIVFAISVFVQPRLVPTTNGLLVLLVTSLVGVLGGLAALNEVWELFRRLFALDSDRRMELTDQTAGRRATVLLYPHPAPPYQAVKLLYLGQAMATDLVVLTTYRDKAGQAQSSRVTEFFPKEDPRMVWHHYQYDFLEPNQVAYFRLPSGASVLDGTVTVTIRFCDPLTREANQFERTFPVEIGA